MVVLEIGSGSHFAGVSCKWTSVVFLAGLVVEVVGLVQRSVVVVVWVLVDRRSVLPAAHQVGG